MGKYGVCSVPGCSKAKAKGLRGMCSSHYYEGRWNIPPVLALDAGEVAMVERVQRLGFLGALKWADVEASR